MGKQVNNGEKHLVRASEIKPERLQYFTSPYLPKRRITILAGESGCGKVSGGGRL